VTSRATYRAQRLVICTGAWMPPVLAPLGIALTVERNTMHWLAERTSAPKMDPSRFPVTLVSDDGIRGTAIFPAIHGSIKIATHHSAAFTTVDGIDRRISARDVAGVTSVAQRYLPRVAGAWERGMTCMYTNTPGGHFILDRHPEHPQVVLGSPCNGFGFKFSAATGEILAMLAVGEQPPVSPEPWSLEAARTPPS
jgi:glycine/D-amino acid oxidase-like deaminating enzyme